MSQFTEMLNISYIENIDTLLYQRFFSEMEKLMQILKRKGQNEEIELLQKRMDYTTKAFSNFERLAEEIYMKNITRKGENQTTSIDEYLIKKLSEIELDMCDQLREDRDKRQVRERIEIMKIIFKNFKGYSEYDKSISKKEEKVKENGEYR